MPAPFKSCKEGNLINNMPTGFPLFFSTRHPRIVAADPWSYLSNYAYEELNQKEADRAASFIGQAYDFYEAAKNPSFGSKPLLFYYSFLNLVKSALLIKKVGIPISVKHGIYDPKANNRTKMYFTKQHLIFNKANNDKSLIMPEFINILGGDSTHDYNFNVMDLLSRIPSIHKTYVNVTKKKPIFVPVDNFEIYSSEGSVWARITINGNERNVRDLKNIIMDKIKKSSFIHRVNPDSNTQSKDIVLLETDEIKTGTKWIDKGILTLSKQLRTFGVYSILVGQGYRFYFSTLPLSKEFPQLAASYAILFYLGTITRYRPGDFSKIIEGKYSWIIDEFLATQPMQFLYHLISYISGVDVVKPFASF